MSHVATLIANRVLPDLEGLAQRAAQVLDAGGKAHWLAPGIAVDIPFTPPGGIDNRLAAGRCAKRSATRRSTSWCSRPPGGASACSSPTWIPP